jgi:protoporphyrinogen/coproporphyrinogen III oxidase
LGVVFDSCAVQGQDIAAGTKLTVMLGGHYWDGWTEIPTEADCVEMARSVLQRHLGVSMSIQPAAVSVKTQRNCIPQYTVGHRERLGRFHSSLLDAFDGRVKVAGSSYTGVGVNDCIRAGMDIAASVTSPGWMDETGLERFTQGQKWARIQTEKGKKNIKVG